jgi:hypothetical protein
MGVESNLDMQRKEGGCIFFKGFVRLKLKHTFWRNN